MSIACRFSLTVGLVLSGGAVAAPPLGADPNSSEAQWYQSLQVPATGASCCGAADCRRVIARQSDRSIGRYDGWSAWPNNVETAVPPSTVILGHSHPAGAAVVCIVNGQVVCFIPPVAAQ